jgi:hypothetical protein
MNRRLDFSKLKFSDKIITIKEALKDVEPFNLDSNTNIKILQQKLNNMDKAVKLAEKNTVRNEQGQVVITKDDEWFNDNIDEIIELDSNTDFDFNKLENNSKETIDNK